MRYFNTRSVSYSINILPNILQFFERTFKIYFNFVLFFKILYIIIILLNINWVGPARLSPVGLIYDPTNPYSSCCFFFRVGWTWPSHLGGVQLRPAWLLARSATLIREGKKRGGGAQPCLAGGKLLLESFLVLWGRPKRGWWWLKHGGGSGQSGGGEWGKKN